MTYDLKNTSQHFTECAHYVRKRKCSGATDLLPISTLKISKVCQCKRGSAATLGKNQCIDSPFSQSRVIRSEIYLLLRKIIQ
jgi:hypothetical protein